MISWNVYFYLFSFVGVLLVSEMYCQTVKTISPCIGELEDGKRIDLTSLAAKNTYKWKQKARNPPGDTHWYYYNPCNSFDLGDNSCPNNAACQATSDEKVFYDLGRQNTAQFVYTTDGELSILYQALDGQRQAGVICSCSKSKEPKFSVFGSVSGQLSYYLMILNSTCCCPDGCKGSGGGLSGGSVLLIIFFCLVFVYVIGGGTYYYVKEKRVAFPHTQFWISQTQNVKDGVGFVIGKVKPGNNNYQSI